MIDMKIKRTELMKLFGVIKNVLVKLGHDERVSMDSAEKYVKA
jgi:hypothetical protein